MRFIARSIIAFTRLSIAFVFAMGLAAQAAFLDDFRGLPSPLTSESYRSKYVAPNELNPEMTIPIINKAAPGVYLTVGSERSFISGALSNVANQIVILDYDPNITVFNNINVELLKASYDSSLTPQQMHERYLHLRLKADAQEWEKALHGQVGVDGKILSSESIQEQYRFWKSTVNNEAIEFKFLHEAPKASEYSPFKNANYLHDTELFAKVQKLAVEHKIHSYVCDLSKIDEVQKILDQMKKNHLKISVFDISNAWYAQYLGKENVDHILSRMEKAQVLEKNSVVMLVDHHNRNQFYKNGERSKTPMFSTAQKIATGEDFQAYGWEYHGYEVDHLHYGKNGTIGIPEKMPKKTSFNDQLLFEKPKTGNCMIRFLRSLRGSL